MTMKSGIDQDALIAMFSQTGAQQGEALRKAVGAATLKALQSREMTLDNVQKVVKTVAGAATMGAAGGANGGAQAEAMLGQVLAGIDSALLQAVEAHRKALEQFMGNGLALGDKPLKAALANIEKMEDTFFGAVAKASQSAGPLQQPWQQALASMKLSGSDTGARATQTVDQLMAQAQTALRDSRAAGLKAAQAMFDNYAAMVSGVLIGMAEGLQAGRVEAPTGGRARAPESVRPAAAPAATPAPARKAAPARKRGAARKTGAARKAG